MMLRVYVSRCAGCTLSGSCISCLRHAEVNLQLEARAVLGVKELQVGEKRFAVVRGGRGARSPGRVEAHALGPGAVPIRHVEEDVVEVSLSVRMDGAREDLVPRQRRAIGLREPHPGRHPERGLNVPRHVPSWRVRAPRLSHNFDGVQERLDVEEHRARPDAVHLHCEPVHARVAFVYADKHGAKTFAKLLEET